MQPDNPVNTQVPDETETMPSASSVAPVVSPEGTATPTVVSGSPNGSKISNVVLFVIVVILGLAIGLGVYFLFVKNLTSKTPVTKATTAPFIGGPTATPLSQDKLDETITNTDTNVQGSVDQANTDLNQVNSINTNQDSTNGL